jgi:hypothetical protein
MRFAKITGLILFSIAIGAVAEVIVGDNYNVAANGTGFALNTGVNAGINPPTTRLTGTAAAGLRYFATGTKTNTVFAINSNKLRVTAATNPGRFVLSANGTSSYDFADDLGTTTASPNNPVVYETTISVMNNSAGTQRCSFAIGTSEGDATTWDFGFQIYRSGSTDSYYVIGKRIDSSSSGLASDINTYITNTAAGTFGTEVTILMRVTDAGSETNSFNSRVQLSVDNGLTWFYDTDTDADLPNGWRLNGPARHIMWDVAPDAGTVTYDNFSLSKQRLSAVLQTPANNATGLGATATLRVLASNALPNNVTITWFGREAPKPGPGRDFLIPVLPDTQNYAREAAGSGTATRDMWYAQTEWIITNRVTQNIPFVATLGDCVQNGDSSMSEWNIATNAMYRLESPSRTLLPDGIPYGVTVGNHDQEPNGDPDGTTTQYNQRFGIARFSDRSYYGGHFSTNNDSWFDLFSAGGMDFIVFSFEYGRYGSTILDWAQDVLATNQTRRVIVLTHHAGDDTPDDTTVAPFSAQGSAIYGALKSNTNFFLMLGGHVFNEGGEGRRSDTFNGRTVRTLISDYQGRFNGGNGLMRLMYFSPSNNLVSVKTYSPYTDNYETDANSQFSFSYNMQPNGAGSPGTPWAAIGTNSHVSPGTQSSFVWGALQANKTYEWYAKITDATGATLFTPSRRFVTGNNSAPVVSNMTTTVVGDQASILTFQATDANNDAITFRTNSRPVRGLITAFNSTSGSATYLPARGFRGLDRVTFQATDSVANSAVANFDVTVVSPPDSNSNGLPDAWESLYGVSNPFDDPDGDGMNNLQEYLANTNPTNAASALKATNAVSTNSSFAFTWPTVGGVRYRIQSSVGGLTTNFIDVIRPLDTEMDPSPVGTPSSQTFTDSNPTNSSKFYRVKVVP